MPTFSPVHRVLNGTSRAHRGRQLLIALGLLATTAATAVAQPAIVTFGGTLNGQLPTLSFGSGPVLTYSSQMMGGFGSQTPVGNRDGRYWNFAEYSGQGMLYGNDVVIGRVLEVRLVAGAGFDLFLNRALFGGYINASRNVAYQLFSDDYSQFTTLASVLTGTFTPATAEFGTNGWGSAIRLQFSEVDANGLAIGRGAFDVGIQDIGYTLRATNGPPTTTVPEPQSFVLLAGGLTVLGVTMRRRAQRA